MNKFQKLNYHKLGVINVTPNSFSDGGINNSANNLLFIFKKFKKINNLIIDIGFESTAPMNKSISAKEERSRFNFFLDSVDEIKSLKIISIDSYKMNNYYYFYSELKKQNKNIMIIFNDVSGIVDQQLFALLKKMPDSFYIYTASKIVSRKNVQAHMNDLIPSKDIVLEIRNQFLKTIELFKLNELEDRLILDPGFGFSKTIEENWELVDRFQELSRDLKPTILLGLSKKSFIHKLILSEDPKSDSELVHYRLITDLLEINPSLIFRVHDPMIMK